MVAGRERELHPGTEILAGGILTPSRFVHF
jgi:hypothetical protein